MKNAVNDIKNGNRYAVKTEFKCAEADIGADVSNDVHDPQVTRLRPTSLNLLSAVVANLAWRGP